MEYLVPPNLEFSFGVFLCLYTLVGILVYNWRKPRSRGRIRVFLPVFFLGIGWQVFSLITVCPNPWNLDSHLIASPGFHRLSFILQTVFWMPMGLAVYLTLQRVFEKKPSKFLRLYCYLGILGYWGLFIFCLVADPFSIPWESFGAYLTICAYLGIVIPPFIVSFANCVLGWHERESLEREASRKLSLLFFFFGLFALGRDVALPFIFYGGVEPLKFLEHTQILTALFLLVFYNISMVLLESKRAKSLVYYVDQVINEGVFIYDKKGCIRYVNASASYLLHLSQDQMETKTIQQLFPQLSVFEECVKKFFQISFSNENHYFYATILKDSIWKGDNTYVLILADDTAEQVVRRGRKKIHSKMWRDQLMLQESLLSVQEESRRKEQMLQMLIDHLPLSISVKNSLGAYVVQNRLDVESQGSRTGTSDKEISEQEKKAFNGDIVEFDKVDYSENGKLLRVSRLSFLPVQETDGSYSVICMRQDRTAEVQMEQERIRLREMEHQRSRLEELGSLAGGIAHDFNNIVGAQLGFCELALEMVEKNSRTYRYLEEIQKAGNRARDIVSDLMTYVRENKESEEESSFGCLALLKDVVSQIRLSLPEGIEFEFENMKAEVLLAGKSADLYRVLMNLIGNALWAMKKEGGKLSISVNRVQLENALPEGIIGESLQGDFVKIEVSDSGEGMSPSVIRRIFSPLFTTRAPGDGYGLGLPTALNLVKGAHGEMTVHSILGKGTKFSVYWPKSTDGGV